MAFREEHCLPAAERGPVECSLYEPALFMNRAIPAEVSTRLEAELAEGRIAAALITAMRGAQMGPAALRALPRPLLEFLAEMAMNGEDKQTGSNYVPMRALAATLRFDSQLAVEMSGKLEDFRSVRADILLLCGRKSPQYLWEALDALQQVLPRA
jgi:hypothetical protein